MSCCAVGQGLCRMKIFVIHFPVVIQGILENSIKNDNLDKQEFHEKLDSIVNSIIEACNRGANPEFLLSCTRNLLNIASTHERFLNLIKLLPDRFEMHGGYSRLLELQYIYDICIGKLQLAPELASSRLYSMISSGQRRDVSRLWDIFRGDFFSEKYAKIRKLIFYESPSFSSQEFSRILLLLNSFHSLTNDTCNPVISHCATFLLFKLSDHLEKILFDSEITFSSNDSHYYSKELNYLILYQNIFPERMYDIEKIYFPSLHPEEEKKEKENENDTTCQEENNECEAENNETQTKKENNEPIIHICSRFLFEK